MVVGGRANGTLGCGIASGGRGDGSWEVAAEAIAVAVAELEAASLACACSLLACQTFRVHACELPGPL